MGGASSKAPRAFTKAPRQFAEQRPQARPQPMTEINPPAAGGSKPVESPHVQAQQSMAAGACGCCLTQPCMVVQMLVHRQRHTSSVSLQGGPACADPQSTPTELPDLPPELQTAEHRRDAELGSLLDKLSGSIGRRQRVAARDQVGFPHALSSATGLSLLA